MRKLSFDGEPITEREKKSFQILDIIREKGPLSRAEVSKATGINMMTVTNYIDNYVKNGIIIEKGLDTSAGGRRPMLVVINDKTGYVIGLGANIAHLIGIVTDLKGKIIHQKKINRPFKPGRIVIDKLMELADELIKGAGIEPAKLKGIGVAIPGVLNKETYTVRWPSGLISEDVVVSDNIKELFEERFDLPAIIENDADASLFGEKWTMLSPDIQNMLYMYSGVGCGIMINGEIYGGASGTAGEFGTFNVGRTDPRLWVQQSAPMGRWEIDLGIVYQAREVFKEKENKNSKIYALVKNEPERIEFNTILKALESEDALAVRLVEDAGTQIGQRIALLINLLNPEVVMVGGGVEQAGTVLFEQIKKTVKSLALEEATRDLRIIPAQLGEMAVAIGAASLVIREIFMRA